MLPDGLKWAPRWEHAKFSNGLFLQGVLVAYVEERVNGTWMARLWCHWPIEAPLVMRDCRSMECGRHGCEIWAARHESRIRREVAAALSRRPRHRGV
jgi:hypothetical protein